jgi:cell division protein FtsZ
MADIIKFDIPKEQRNNIIKVIGVGGGGGNAINHMYRMGIKDVDFIICNTDAQALNSSPIPTKVFLGKTLTEGLGAGSNPDIGNLAAEESREEIEQLLSKNTKMVFITAGMGGGTGTGAAPVIARIAKDLGILTIGIITTPFMREGRRKRNLAEEGINELRKNTDSVIMVNNDKLPLLFGNLSMNAAFAKADDVLCTAAKGISELITITGRMNVDFADVRNAMTDSGSALMGIGEANGQNRAIEAINAALESPLLNDANVNGGFP